MKCPDCGAVQFYVKDPDDHYTISEFTFAGESIQYVDGEEDHVEVMEDSEIYCDRCAWHDKLKSIRK